MTALASLSSTAVAELSSSATLVLPVGAVEQHGPHLPLGVDAFMAEHIATTSAQRAEDRAGRPVLVAPVIPVGSSHHHLPMAGTLSLRSGSLLGVLADLLASAARGGLRRVVLFNGHGGNEDIVRQAVRDAALDHDITAAAVSYWTPAWQRLCDEARRWDIGPLPGHAGTFETSLMLHLRPDLVDMSSAEEVDRPLPFSSVHPQARAAVESHGWVQRLGGRTDGPAKASAEAGAALMEIAVEGAAEFLAEFAGE